jgi:drug/metabolite transporter (DMT)-like permease
MLVGLACAVGTSLCYGIGSVLQSVAAVEAPSSERLDPGLLLVLLRSWRYLLGLALDGIGFVLSLVALRSLPLYVVQSVVASFLAVTAVAGALLVGARVRREERAAVAAVVLGLALVCLSAAPEQARAVGSSTEWLVLVAALTLAVVSLPLSRLTGGRGAWGLGGIAGVAFGVVAVGARALSPSWTPGDLTASLHGLLVSPASYGLLVAAPLALVSYATALQRGSVVQATAPLVVGETALPALVGLTLLGDHPRPGWSAAATAGFLLSVGAAVALSRFGEVSTPPAEDRGVGHGRPTCGAD